MASKVPPIIPILESRGVEGGSVLWPISLGALLALLLESQAAAVPGGPAVTWSVCGECVHPPRSPLSVILLLADKAETLASAALQARGILGLSCRLGGADQSRRALECLAALLGCRFLPWGRVEKHSLWGHSQAGREGAGACKALCMLESNGG